MRFINLQGVNRAKVFLRLLFVLTGLSLATFSIADPGIVQPAGNAAISGTTQTFSWSADGVQVDRWWLYVGTSSGSYNIANSGDLGSETQFEVNGIPIDGSAIYVRIWYENASGWVFSDSEYTSAVIDNPTAPSISSLANDTVLRGGSADFQWSYNSTPVKYWWLHIGSNAGGKDFFSSGALRNPQTATTVNDLPTDGSKVYVRLWYWTINKGWRFVENIYDTAGNQADDVADIKTSAAANLDLIKNNATRNTQFDDNPFRDVPASDISVSDLTIDSDIYNEALLDTSTSGYFRVKCEVSHFAYDDPIVHPNQPGRAHLHMFFGNTDANAFSTFDSLLNSGTGTCNGEDLNRTAYWVPAMLDSQGNALIPDQIMVYYKNDNFRLEGANELVNPFPDNLRMIAGNASATSPQTGFTGEWEVQPTISFSCGPAYNAPSRGALIPDCFGSENQLEMTISFPQCFDEDSGTYLSNQSHMSYSEGGYYGARCPDSHSTDISSIMYRIFFRTDEYGGSLTDLHLSSDVKMDRILPGGTTSHADWFGAWHPEAMGQWVENCNNTQADCETGLLGRSPAKSLVLRKQNFYDYGYKAPASELIKLCPGKIFNPEDPLRSVAMCRMN